MCHVNKTVAVPQLKEFQESVQTKPIFHYRNSLAVLYLSAEDRMGSVTTQRIIATLLLFPHSLSGKRQYKKNAAGSSFLISPTNSLAKLNSVAKKRGWKYH